MTSLVNSSGDTRHATIRITIVTVGLCGAVLATLSPAADANLDNAKLLEAYGLPSRIGPTDSWLIRSLAESMLRVFLEKQLSPDCRLKTIVFDGSSVTVGLSHNFPTLTGGQQRNEQEVVEDSNTSYGLRVYLGVLAGLAIGWGFTSNVLPGGDVVRALSPLALAFLAGYSVELLFSAMDRLLDAFSAKSPTSRPPVPSDRSPRALER